MDPKSIINVHISTQTIAKAILVAIFFALLFYVRDIVLVVLAAVVIASSIEPATRWFAKYKISRLPAVVTTYVGIAVICAAVFYILIPPLLNDTSSLLSKVPQYLENVSVWNPISNSDNIIATEQAAKGIKGISSLSVSSEGLVSFGGVIQSIQNALSNTSEGFINTVSLIFGGVLSFILIVVLSFYLAVQEDGVANFLRVIVPVRQQKYVIDLWKRSQLKIGLWMQGQLLLGLIVAVLVYLGLTILGIKNALLLAILAGVFELIPVFGPILSAIPAVLVAYFDAGGLSSALLVAGLYLIIQQFENHLIYPLVVRKIVGVSPIVVILAFIIGAKLAGFLGILLAVPVSSALMEYFHDVERHKISEREKLAADV